MGLMCAPLGPGGLGPCGPAGPFWAGPLWAPLGSFGLPWALVGPAGPLWAGPLWAGPLGPPRKGFERLGGVIG